MKTHNPHDYEVAEDTGFVPMDPLLHYAQAAGGQLAPMVGVEYTDLSPPDGGNQQQHGNFVSFSGPSGSGDGKSPHPQAEGRPDFD